eukprot:scaffold13842_cov115-Isochrysis_galbana.AAC.1
MPIVLLENPCSAVASQEVTSGGRGRGGRRNGLAGAVASGSDSRVEGVDTAQRPKACDLPPSGRPGSRRAAGGMASEEKAATAFAGLQSYLEKCGGAGSFISGWTCTIEPRLHTGRANGESDSYFFSPAGKRFRSRVEVARHFSLVPPSPEQRRLVAARGGRAGGRGGAKGAGREEGWRSDGSDDGEVVGRSQPGDGPDLVSDSQPVGSAQSGAASGLGDASPSVSGPQSVAASRSGDDVCLLDASDLVDGFGEAVASGWESGGERSLGVEWDEAWVSAAQGEMLWLDLAVAEAKGGGITPGAGGRCRYRIKHRAVAAEQGACLAGEEQGGNRPLRRPVGGGAMADGSSGCGWCDAGGEARGGAGGAGVQEVGGGEGGVGGFRRSRMQEAGKRRRIPEGEERRRIPDGTERRRREDTQTSPLRRYEEQRGAHCGRSRNRIHSRSRSRIHSRSRSRETPREGTRATCRGRSRSRRHSPSRAHRVHHKSRGHHHSRDRSRSPHRSRNRIHSRSRNRIHSRSRSPRRSHSRNHSGSRDRIHSRNGAYIRSRSRSSGRRRAAGHGAFGRPSGVSVEWSTTSDGRGSSAGDIRRDVPVGKSDDRWNDVADVRSESRRWERGAMERARPGERPPPSGIVHRPVPPSGISCGRASPSGIPAGGARPELPPPGPATPFPPPALCVSGCHWYPDALSAPTGSSALELAAPAGHAAACPASAGDAGGAAPPACTRGEMMPEGGTGGRSRAVSGLPASSIYSADRANPALAGAAAAGVSHPTASPVRLPPAAVASHNPPVVSSDVSLSPTAATRSGYAFTFSCAGGEAGGSGVVPRRCPIPPPPSPWRRLDGAQPPLHTCCATHTSA